MTILASRRHGHTTHIHDVPYTFTPIDCDPSIGADAWRVRNRSNGAVYDLHRDTFGQVHCTCPDFVYRHEGRAGETCKHLAAAIRCGWMAPPIGAPEPTADPREPAEDWGPADAWPVGPWDDGRWEVGPDPGEPRPIGLALDDALRAIAASYRAVPSDLGALLAETIEGLIVEVEVTHARDVAELRDRRAALVSAYAPDREFRPAPAVIDPAEPRGALCGHPDRDEGPPEPAPAPAPPPIGTERHAQRWA